MHTLRVIVGGFVLLAVCLLIARVMGGTRASMAKGALAFMPLWLIAAAVNLWIGVSHAGYTVAQEAPIFLVVFGGPAIVAAVLWRWLV
jgi:hypothetical protein